MSVPESRDVEEVEARVEGMSPAPAPQGAGETPTGEERVVKRVRVTIEVSEGEPLWVLFLRAWTLTRERKIPLPEAFKQVLIGLLSELEELEGYRDMYYGCRDRLREHVEG